MKMTAIFRAVTENTEYFREVKRKPWGNHEIRSQPRMKTFIRRFRRGTQIFIASGMMMAHFQTSYGDQGVN
jgi:hypothetical protein